MLMKSLNFCSISVKPQQNSNTKLITKVPEVRDCSANICQPPNPPAVLCAKSGIASALRPQSPSALFEPFPDVSKSESHRSQPVQTSADALVGPLSEVCGFYYR